MEDLIREEMAPWLVSSVDAFNINLIRAGPNTDVFEAPFKPVYTHGIFGKDETIFGYKDLELRLRFRAHDLKPSLDISHGETFKAIGQIKPMDLREMLKDFIEPEALSGEGSANGTPAEDVSRTWAPPGQIYERYAHNGSRFEIWCGSLSNPALRQILKNGQVLVPLFIDGGTLQNLDDPDWTIERWKLFLLYEITPLQAEDNFPPYKLAGFATSYRLWVFPTTEILALTGSPPGPSSGGAGPVDDVLPNNYSPLDAPSRERISQFIIIPPFQGQGHGSRLYNAIMSMFLNDKHVFEVTVEGPNEAFDDLRDRCDLERLRQNSTFAAVSIAETISEESLAAKLECPSALLLPEDELERIRHEAKIIPRQFSRLVEMHTLSQIPEANRKLARITRKHRAADANDRRYYLWRHLTKARLYVHNRDQLMQIDEAERIDKIQAVLPGLEASYEEVLKRADRRPPMTWQGDGERRSTKRKFVVDADDDDTEDEEMEVELKKTKVELLE